ncbi:tetratricopeptide repeat protein [Rhodoferax sp.]|uniref:tetratricopeptide repeat protein n=1 Tax=Rhodoferax sp. TaxID=50421 RepID=UPI002743FC3B|nr:tetratricopeptide repeat protein [Rhodoferax sp.]
MRIKLLLAGMVCTGFSPLQATQWPATGADYYSLRIASGKDAQALQTLYPRYIELPFVQRNWREDTALGAVTAARPEPAPTSTLLTALPPVVPTSPPVPRKIPDAPARQDLMRPFHQEDFALAYDIFLGSGDLERAFLVARQAVQQVANDSTWRRKLAHVAEWTQRPLVAAEQWRALFQQGDRAVDTVSGVIRLAALLEDPAIALQAWVVRAKQTTLTDAQWEAIFELHESAVEPARGSRFFEAQFGQKKNPLLLEYAARLAGNAGEDERAETLYIQRSQLEPFSMDVILRAVVSLIRRDHMREALALMQTHEGRVEADTAEFWRLLSELAWKLRDYDAAQGAYHRYAQTPQATPADWSRLVFLVRQKHPAQAAELALEAYRRFDALEQLVSGLEIYAEIGDFQAQARVFKSLGPAALTKAEQVVRFLQIRAQFYQRQKMPDLAWADLRQAGQMSPDDSDVILASLWFLIDEARTDDLKIALKQFSPRVQTHPAYWLAYAAANQVLDRHREAVIWYTREIRRNPDDPLILLNYAEALERSQRAGMAARVRRHAWLILKQKYPQPVNLRNLGKNPELLAMARLAILDRPGDPAMQVVRHLASQMRSAPPGQADDGQVIALVLGWAIVKEQFANARAWMWLRYARQSQKAPPLWGDSQVALQLAETQSLKRLLAHNSEGLPIYNRYDTAYTLGHVRQALDIAFKGMTQQEGDEPLYDRFRQHAPLHANYVQLRATHERQGSLANQGVQWEARWVADPKLHVILGWSRMGQSGDDPTLAPALPGSDRLNSLEARWSGQRGDSQLSLNRRHEWHRYTGLRMGQTLQWGGRVNLEAGLAYRADSAVSQPMQVYGYEHSLHASVNYALGKREYLRIAPRTTRYYRQDGHYLGRGHILDLEAGYRIRTEYPDWRVRAFSTLQRFLGDGSPDRSWTMLPAKVQTSIAERTLDPVAYFIPERGATWGACIGMGEDLAGQDLQTVYSRAWRPFLNLCLSHNSAGNTSHSGILGIAGSLTGEDHLSVQWQGSEEQVPGTPIKRALAIRYRHYF